MSQAAQAQAGAKPKFASRLVRAYVYGFLVGFMLFLAGLVFGQILSQLDFNVLPPVGWGVIGFGFGFLAPVAIEISKEMEG